MNTEHFSSAIYAIEVLLADMKKELASTTVNPAPSAVVEKPAVTSGISISIMPFADNSYTTTNISYNKASNGDSDYLRLTNLINELAWGTVTLKTPMSLSKFTAGDVITFSLRVPALVTEYMTLAFNNPSSGKVVFNRITKDLPINKWFNHSVIITDELLKNLNGSITSIHLGNYAPGTIDVSNIAIKQAEGGSLPSYVGPVNIVGKRPYVRPNNFYLKNIKNTPVHPRSSDWIKAMNPNTRLHADFSSYTENGVLMYGIPYNVMPITSSPTISLNVLYKEDHTPTDLKYAKSFPYNDKLLVEPGSDSHLIIVDPNTGDLIETFMFSYNKQRDATTSIPLPNAYAVTYFNLNSNAMRPVDYTSADASGLPIYPALLTYDDIVDGPLQHAVRFTANNVPSYIWPARHKTSSTAGSSDGIHSDANMPGFGAPYGARFRLKASIDISKYSPRIRNLLIGLQNFGIVLQDNGSPGFLTGVPDSRWDDDELKQINQISLNDFEAVDMSVHMVSPTSYECK